MKSNSLTPKKVLFLITKSNWGKKVSKHFRKTLPSIFGENGDKAETELIILFQKVASYFVKNSDNLYSFCKKYSVGTTELSRPII